MRLLGGTPHYGSMSGSYECVLVMDLQPRYHISHHSSVTRHVPSRAAEREAVSQCNMKCRDISFNKVTRAGAGDNNILSLSPIRERFLDPDSTLTVSNWFGGAGVWEHCINHLIVTCQYTSSPSSVFFGEIKYEEPYNGQMIFQHILGSKTV